MSYEKPDAAKFFYTMFSTEIRVIRPKSRAHARVKRARAPCVIDVLFDNRIWRSDGIAIGSQRGPNGL